MGARRTGGERNASGDAFRPDGESGRQYYAGTILVTRIAGLLLAAIAVQLVADAVQAFIESA